MHTGDSGEAQCATKMTMTSKSTIVRYHLEGDSGKGDIPGKFLC